MFSNNLQVRLNPSELAAIIDAIPAYRGKTVLKDPYIYTVQIDGIVAATQPAPPAIVPGIGNRSFNVDADADFLILDIGYQVRVQNQLTPLTESTRLVPDLRVQLTDTGSGRRIMDAPVPLPLIGGVDSIQLPYESPKLIPAKGSFQVDAYNYNNVVYDLFLAFKGVKLFVYA
jgi:hypothetical protein